MTADNTPEPPASRSSLPRWRDEDPGTFRATLLVAAEQLGIQPLAVQKDYWVCETLRAIDAHRPDAVVFKGGTSLEKLRIVQRFSEDLDLLVVGNLGGEAATKTAMKAIIEAAHAAVGGSTPTPERSGGKLGSLHRSAYLHPTLDAPNRATAIADPGAVLLELGQSGGSHPSQRCEITSLLTRQLQQADFDVRAYVDLEPFSVQVLHPGRTLLEKLLRVNNFVVNFGRDRNVLGWPRIGRQFYDLWALLGNHDVLALLADQVAAAEVLTDCFRVSTAFGGDQPVPEGGFASCVAFDRSGPLSGRLRAEHEAAMRDLYYGSGPGVAFDDVLARVHEKAHLLDIAPRLVPRPPSAPEASPTPTSATSPDSV